MAKKTALQSTMPASKFDGGLLGLIGTSLLALLAFILWAAVAAGVLFGGYFLTSTVLEFVASFEMDKETLLSVLIIALYAWYALVILIALIPFGCGVAAMSTTVTRWTVRHTVISDKRLRFTGTAPQLFGNQVKWFFLTILTLGIYGLWVPIKYKKWEVKHTVFEDDTPYVAPAQQAPVQIPTTTAQPPVMPMQNGYPTPIVLPPVYPCPPNCPPVPPCGYNQNKQ